MIRRRIARRRFAFAAAAVAAFVLFAARRARAEEPDLKSEGTRDLTMTVGEAERTWRLHLPKRENGKMMPLVIAIHGAMSSGKQMEGITGFDALADKKGFAVAYPDGEKHLWNYIKAA